nr:hypothetical protein CFP56_28498 [Quercus suber]
MRDCEDTESRSAGNSIRIHVQYANEISSSQELPRMDLLRLTDTLHSTDCSVIRSSVASLAKLRTLSSCGTTLLFTPAAVPFDPTIVETMCGKDPFEYLGRVFCQLHGRVRHVPYLPDIGFTHTHRVFLRHCDTVVVVMCQPFTEAEAGFSEQADFADGVAEFLSNTDLITPCIPKCLIQFGFTGAQIDLPAYENVLRTGAYNQHTARRIVQLMHDTP